MGSPHDTRDICPRCRRWVEKGSTHVCQPDLMRGLKIDCITVRIAPGSRMIGAESCVELQIDLHVNGEDFHYREAIPDDHFTSLFDRIMGRAKSLLKQAVEKKFG